MTLVSQASKGNNPYIMNLQLEKLSVVRGQATGGELIIATVNSVQEDDIEVYFIEKVTGWQTQARIDQGGIHSNNTIHFYSPSYSDVEITAKVKVDVQLRRPSDGVQSNVLPFTFVPSLTNKNIPIQQLLSVHSSLKDTHFRESAVALETKQDQSKHEDFTDGESSSCALKKRHKLQKADTIQEESYELKQEARSSVDLRRVDSPSTDACQSKFLKIQHKSFSVSGDSGYGSYISNEENPLKNDSKTAEQKHLPTSGKSGQQSTRSGNASGCEVEVDSFFKMSKKSVMQICVSSNAYPDIFENQESVTSGYCSSTSTLPSPESSQVLSPHDPQLKEDTEEVVPVACKLCKITSPGTKAKRIIPRIKVDSSGACLKLPHTGVQLIIPPCAIPEGDVAEIGLALDANHLNFPGSEDDGCIAPIVTCLPNRYQFQMPVLIVFPHSAKDTVGKDCPLKLYTSHTDLDEKNEWKQVEFNQKDDSSSPILFLQNQYAYLFVKHFTDHAILLPSGCFAKYMRIVVYANELYDCQTNQKVQIYCHGERKDWKKKVEEEEKGERNKMTSLLEFELIKKGNADLKVNLTIETGWIMKSRKKEQLLEYLWRKDFGSCHYTFKNTGNMREFYCQISIQQVGCDYVGELDFTNRVNDSNLPPGSLRGPLSADVVGTHSSSIDSRPHTSYMPSTGSQNPTDSGLTSTSYHGEISTSVRYSHYGGPNPQTQNPHLNAPNSYYMMPRQMSCPFSHPPPVNFQANQPIANPVKLPYTLRMKLRHKLDPKMPNGSDWRMLASELKHDNLINLFESMASMESPTLNVLQMWETKEETLQKLAEHLHAIERPDAARLVENHIKENPDQQHIANTLQKPLAIHPKGRPFNTNPLAISPLGGHFTPNNPPAPGEHSPPLDRQDYQSDLDDTDPSIVGMSTSSSSSSFLTTPEFELPNLTRSTSDVFYDPNRNERIQETTTSIKNLNLSDNINEN